ncbi:MAG: hypothetical protein RRX88_06800 [Raoultibacter sp.]
MESAEELNGESKTAAIKNSAFYQKHPDSLAALENTPEKSASPSEHTTDPLNSYIIDVETSVLLRTFQHPEGERVTLWCNSQPSPAQSEGLYFFWAWQKSNWQHNENTIRGLGIPIIQDEYCQYAPCAIAIPFTFVISDQQ